MDNLKKIGEIIKNNYKIIIPIILMLVLFIAFFVYYKISILDNYRKDTKDYFYQYFYGKKYEYNGVVTTNRHNVIVDFKGQVVILCDVNPIKRWHHAVNNLEDNINEKLKVNVVICASFLREDPVQINIVYNSLCNRIIDKSKKSDMLIEVQKYINRNYFNENLSIAEVANVMKVSQAYLIRVFKRDLKMNFADYLTNVRIKNAIILMRDNELKLNDISKMVGYNTQHYFSNVFRKHVGISPQDYRIGMGS